MALFVMLNNFLHDFAVALLFASLLVLSVVYRRAEGANNPAAKPFFRQLQRVMTRIITGCWVFILAGGVVRTLAYRQYEWMEAAGRGQIAALITGAGQRGGVDDVFRQTDLVTQCWLSRPDQSCRPGNVRTGHRRSLIVS